jgi:thymidylate synthase (FAD)
MVEFKFHVRVPMDCWRQWIRHRTASVNEYSTRYSEVIGLYQKTPPNSWRLQATNNKQGSYGYYNNDSWLCEEEQQLHHIASHVYKRRLDCGIAREQARKDLPLSTYTEAYWKIDLHNLLHFLSLRCDSHAQLEIRSYANVIAGIVKGCCPITFEAWEDYTFGAVTFSRQEMFKIYRMIHYGTSLKDVLDDDTLTKRETEEFIYKIDKEPRQFDAVLPNARPYESFMEEHHEKNHQMAEPTSGN